MTELKLGMFVAVSVHVFTTNTQLNPASSCMTVIYFLAEDQLLRKKVVEFGAPHTLSPTWGQEVTVKMQCVLEDRTVVEKDCNLVFVIGEGDVNQVNPSV